MNVQTPSINNFSTFQVLEHQQRIEVAIDNRYIPIGRRTMHPRPSRVHSVRWAHERCHSWTRAQIYRMKKDSNFHANEKKSTTGQQIN